MTFYHRFGAGFEKKGETQVACRSLGQVLQALQRETEIAGEVMKGVEKGGSVKAL